MSRLKDLLRVACTSKTTMQQHIVARVASVAQQACNSATDDLLHDSWVRGCNTQQHATPTDPATETRRVKALAMLAADPQLHLAIVVDDPDSDPVICTVGIRHVAVGEIEIPAIAYNPAVLMELLDRHSSGTETDCEMRNKGHP
jgi:hypothetical protein